MSTILSDTGLTQRELSWALNATQPSVSRWLGGKRAPSAEVRTRLDLIDSAKTAPYTVVDADNPRGGIIMPSGMWTCAFSPRGKFRLPVHLNWTGTATERILDGGDLYDRMHAYMLVLTNGRAQDIRAWVDLVELASNIDTVIGSRRHIRVWKTRLTEMGMV